MLEGAQEEHAVQMAAAAVAADSLTLIVNYIKLKEINLFL
jgi:hypothetical protein